jgi:hypothetical protein
MKTVLIKSSFIFLLFIFCSLIGFNNKQIKSNEKFLIQNSLITNNKFFKRIVYFGYTKNEKDSTKWNDKIKIYHVKKNDTILKTEFIFYRQKYEGGAFLAKKSSIPYCKIGLFDFIFRTIISNKGNYSENIFTFNSISNKYFFVKRINFMENKFKDTLGLKTTYNINKSVFLIDSLTLKNIYKNEYDIYKGKRFKNCEWVTHRKKK